ncbi:MAG: hypothetical protein EXX96DRAFT_555354 [Benjaminiella poitrasii]|nr:MAG: hypothetical protein EXX96DRAFT_555354 [Benjaminiella poitrasii]
MRHVRILNILIPNQLSLKRRLFTPCLGCGRLTIPFRPYTQAVPANNTTTATITPPPKYAHLPARARPAEPSIAITKLAAQGRATDALDVYLGLLRNGGFPSRKSLYQLTEVMYRTSNLRGMYVIHHTLTAYYNQDSAAQSKRNARSLNYLSAMLINLIVKETQPIDWNMIRTIFSRLPRFSTEKTKIVIYNTLIGTLLDKNYVREARGLLDDLERQNVKPTLVTYKILMKDACKRKELDYLIYLLDAFAKDETLEIGCVITSIVAKALCNVHEFDKAIKLADELYCPSEKDRLSSLAFKQDLVAYVEKKRSIAIDNLKTPKKKRKKRKKDIIELNGRSEQ